MRQIKFIFILLVVVLFSYGQIVGMHVWQDDNGLFFKLAHISERAGYLSAGPFGSGPYKYIATPYIPIYYIFGHNTVPYFILTLIVYFLTTVVVYKVYKAILGRTGGRIAGLLYAAGYIASDGFIRLFNSVVTSVSVLTISLFTFSYWSFFKKKSIKWYFLALIFYFLSVELARGRTHYLIGIVLIFELLFFRLRKPIVRAVGMLFLRLLAFGLIFYRYFIENADQRSSSVGKFVLGLLKGEHYQIYGFVSSVANLFVPDWLTSFFLENVSYRWAWVTIIFITFSAIFYIHREKTRLLIFSSTIFLVWIFLSREIFSVPQIDPSGNQRIITLLGGSILILLFCFYFALKRKYKKIYVLLGLWSFINIAAYSAYNPLVVYESINRYLAHSFYATVGLLAILFVGIKKRKMAILIKFWVAIWGLGNIVSSVVYQNNVLKNRSLPARKFYQQLKTFVPNVNKGDVFYFNVTDGAQSYFSNAFSVASMPETTAIAWRYGLDRYDLSMFTDFENLIEHVKSKNIEPEKIYTFWYGRDGLVDTSQVTRNYLSGDIGDKTIDELMPMSKSDLDIQRISDKNFWLNNDLEVNLSDGIDISVPVEIVLEATAGVTNLGSDIFPLYKSGQNPNNLNFKDPDLIQKVFLYKNEKVNQAKFAKFSVSTSWRERGVENIHDMDTSTVWQPDRLKWRESNEYLTVDLGKMEYVSRFVWINGFGNNTPTKYQIETSSDGIVWKIVKIVESYGRIDDKTQQVVEFDSTFARFVKMKLLDSLNKDSPGISEVWVIPTRFDEINIIEVEKFLQEPFGFIPDEKVYMNLLKFFSEGGSAQLFWQTNASAGWQTTQKNKVDLVYDGKSHKYSIYVLPNGTKLEKIKLSEFNTPGNVTVNRIEIRYHPNAQFTP